MQDHTDKKMCVSVKGGLLTLPSKSVDKKRKTIETCFNVYGNAELMGKKDMPNKEISRLQTRL